MAQSKTVTLGWGADFSGPVLASKSQREQGAVAFVRSQSLTVNGKPAAGSASRFGFRLAGVTAAAFLRARPAPGKAGRITLPLAPRGRPVSKAATYAEMAASMAPSKPRTARRPRKVATVAPSTATE